METPPTIENLQQRVQPWLIACFGAEIARDKTERNHRFLEESIELVQATGCTQSEAHQLVDYVFGRPLGEPHQEVGGVMITLAALCIANGLDMDQGGEDELARIWTKVEKIRAKQTAKPKHGPLAEAPAEQYLLISLPRSQNEVWFWGPDEKGYTRDASRAGRYTQETAHQIIQGTSGEVIAMLESDLTKLVINHVIDLGWGDNGPLIKTLYTLALPTSALS